MFFLPPDAKYEGADLSPIAVGDGHITFTKSFKLLGSMLAYDLEDNDAIECRIKRAQGAFSAMQKQFWVFSAKGISAKGIKNSHMKAAYEGLILSILLYNHFMVVKHGAWLNSNSVGCTFSITAVCGLCAGSLCGMSESTRSLKPILSTDYFWSHLTTTWRGAGSDGQVMDANFSTFASVSLFFCWPQTTPAKASLRLWTWSEKGPQQCMSWRDKLWFSSNELQPLACFYITEECSLQLQRNWLRLDRWLRLRGSCWMHHTFAVLVCGSHSWALRCRSNCTWPAVCMPSRCHHLAGKPKPWPSIYAAHSSSTPNANSSLTILSSPIIPHVPQRYSCRLAAKAEQKGGRLVYSHTEAPRKILI